MSADYDKYTCLEVEYDDSRMPWAESKKALLERYGRKYQGQELVIRRIKTDMPGWRSYMLLGRDK